MIFVHSSRILSNNLTATMTSNNPAHIELISFVPFLYVDFYLAVEEQNVIIPVVRDMNFMCFLEFIFQRDGIMVVSEIGFGNQFFEVLVNGLGSFSRKFKDRIFLCFFVSFDNFVDSLQSSLKKSSNI